ncbi:MAG: double-strand break repair protein AddB [Pseudomonadota bacterium]
MTGPRIFSLPCGVDFAQELVAGLRARFGQPPEAMARVQIFVNTARMRSAVETAFIAKGPGFLPRIQLVTDIGADLVAHDLPPAVPDLQRRLELTRLVGKLIEKEPDLAPRTALFSLSDSLAALLGEMAGEGVDPKLLADLDIADVSGHWQRSLQFLQIASTFADAPDKEARQRLAVDRMVAAWDAHPPDHPVIVAGSTGSRGPTLKLMTAVAGLPQGALVLPGFDATMPERIWKSLPKSAAPDDHPQFRFAVLLDRLGLTANDVAPWSAVAPPSAARNRLVSLALRPAPVTDEWLRDGAALYPELEEATAGLSLLEADDERLEAAAIAVRLRQAAEDGQTAALITPDRVLVRRVTAALDRWGIRPDVSAGRPLHLSAPGRFLRQISAVMGRAPTLDALLALLKHPITHSDAGRGDHLRHTRDLELFLRDRGLPFATEEALDHWSAKEDRSVWAPWLSDLLHRLARIRSGPMDDLVRVHLDLADRLARGTVGSGSGELWLEDAGALALASMSALQSYAPEASAMAPADYTALVGAVLAGENVRAAVGVHPTIMIWGTLEARLNAAEVTILAGLNEGVWPEMPAPDPWLSRGMRRALGLPAPERLVGLAAHDFQQAIGTPEVLLCRSVRSADAETVPSRWINRLTNLLGGLGDAGPEALKSMQSRGRHWIDIARGDEARIPRVAPEPRPSPVPPTDAQPRRLRATAIKTLKRDPYAIYASEVLRLRPLGPLNPDATYALRGTVLHRVMETFVRQTGGDAGAMMRTRLLAVADQVLGADVPWPLAQRLWQARIAASADWIIQVAHKLGHAGTPLALEARGSLTIQPAGLIIRGIADRIDRLPGGQLAVYDYKTGHVPTAKEQRIFDKQLALMALMAEAGGFLDAQGQPLTAAPVASAAFIGLGTAQIMRAGEVSKTDLAEVLEDLTALVSAYLQGDAGYTARALMQKQDDAGDYDHLSRFGEWSASSAPTRQEVGR